MEKFSLLYVSFTPLLFWTALFFVSRYLVYPVRLKKKLKDGETWVYIPAWWAKSKVKVLLLKVFYLFTFLSSVLLSSFFVAYALFLLGLPVKYGFISVLIFLAIGIFISFKAGLYAFELEKALFFLYIQRLRVAAQRKGISVTMDNLRSRSSWELHRTLLRVERRGSFFKYLRAASKTEKFPKELYTEVVR